MFCLFFGESHLGLGYCGPEVIYPETEEGAIGIRPNFPQEIVELLNEKNTGDCARNHTEEEIRSLLTTDPMYFSIPLEKVTELLLYWNKGNIAVSYKPHFFLAEYLKKFSLKDNCSPTLAFGKRISGLDIYCHECSEVFENLDAIFWENGW